uniref:Acetyltransferase GNAT domain protein n=1 Tax=Pithovirus LCDPAC01 TaxID=2506600 RepID=A0A481YP66_9VIRU|nr:MAG: acetyltransferase GNAT domain protein [Pithovirus LCDPAC01]
MDIRLALLQESKELVSFVKEHYDIGKSVNPYISYDDMKRYISSNQSFVLIATDKNVTGFVLCIVLENKKAKYCHVTFLCVDKNKRKKGIAKLLISKIKTECEERKIENGLYIGHGKGVSIKLISRPLNHKKCRNYGIACVNNGTHKKLKKLYSVALPEHCVYAETEKFKITETNSIYYTCKCIRFRYLNICSLFSTETVTISWKPLHMYHRKLNKEFEMAHVFLSTRPPKYEEMQALFHYLHSLGYWNVFMYGMGHLANLEHESFHTIGSKKLQWFEHQDDFDKLEVGQLHIPMV